MSKHKNTIALVVAGDVGDEPYAIRNTLEYFGYRIIYIPIGRPNDFIAVLNREFLYDDVSILIICSHGNEGKIIMPVLADDIYTDGEPKIDFDGAMIETYAQLTGLTVILTGCTLAKLAESFKTSGCKNVIATNEHIDGNAALIFTLYLFYQLSEGDNIATAFEKAAAINNETKLFRLF
ncbi:MAG: delta-aminolevulinic acid dehydratase [Chitinophagaceae bacterium]|nr:delta-aminolevulinic acid dehydratase [Chitinophagaceae bacterium]